MDKDILRELASETRKLAKRRSGAVKLSFQRHAEKLEEEANLLPFKNQQTMPNLNLLFGGSPVIDGVGLDAKFTARVLDPFVGFVKDEYATVSHGQLGSRGRTKESIKSDVIITDVVHGSFGFKVTGGESGDLTTPTYLQHAFKRLGSVLKAVATDGDSYLDEVLELSDRSFNKFKELVREMATFRAGVHIVGEDIDVTLSPSEVQSADQRLSVSVIEEVPEEVVGRFGGATLGRIFEHTTEEGKMIRGRLNEEIDDKKCIELALFINRKGKAKLMRVSIKTGNISRNRFELLDFTPTE